MGWVGFQINIWFLLSFFFLQPGPFPSIMKSFPLSANDHSTWLITQTTAIKRSASPITSKPSLPGSMTDWLGSLLWQIEKNHWFLTPTTKPTNFHTERWPQVFWEPRMHSHLWTAKIPCVCTARAVTPNTFSVHILMGPSSVLPVMERETGILGKPSST